MFYGSIVVDYQTALIVAKPMILVPGVSIDVPDHRVMACSQAWSHIPAYGTSALAFDRIASSVPWFGILSRVSGFVLQFHYSETAARGERIQVRYNADELIPNGQIELVHEIPGVSEGRCFDVTVLWAIALAHRQQAKGRGAASISRC